MFSIVRTLSQFSKRALAKISKQNLAYVIKNGSSIYAQIGVTSPTPKKKIVAQTTKEHSAWVVNKELAILSYAVQIFVRESHGYEICVQYHVEFVSKQ